MRYFFRQNKGPRYRLPDDYGTDRFWRAYRLALAGVEPCPMEPSPIVAEIMRTLTVGVNRARGKAAAKSLPFDLTAEWAIAVAKAQGWRCAMTGIPFFHACPVKSHMRPFAPSFDRIVPGGGYTQDNVRIVVFALNSMLSDWGDEVMRAVASGYAFRQNKSRTGIPALSTEHPRTFSEGEADQDVGESKIA